MIIINKPSVQVSEEELLARVGFKGFEFSNDTTFEEAMYPGDESISVGYYNNNIIINDDYKLTTEQERGDFPESLAAYEQTLTALFPDSEILSVACHSAVNYHLYSLVKNGQKLRFKTLTADTPLMESGERLPEEEAVYALSQEVDGQRLFRSPYSDEPVYDNTEDQMMEDFTFGVAKRHLGVMISSSEDEELMFHTSFRRYVRKQHTIGQQTPVGTSTPELEKKKSSFFGSILKALGLSKN